MKTLLVFAATNSTGYYHECSYISPDMETAFVTLNALVAEGWQLHIVKMFDHCEHSITLPVDAFDGQPILATLEKLEREWTSLLLTK